MGNLPPVIEDGDNSKEILSRNKADILRILCYPDVAAHMLSRGVISMPEHRQIFALTDEVARVNKFLEVIQDRENSLKHLIDALSDNDLPMRGKYKQLIKCLV